MATNTTGANMPAGHVAALVGAPDAPRAVLEVDESYLGILIDAARPDVVVLLNLSRDQLDRIAEVRMLVDRWRGALGGLDRRTVVVANADDPMVVWAAQAAPRVRWVGAGQVWHEDAVGCPACGGRIAFAAGGSWACDTCAFARPAADGTVEGTDLVLADGTRHALDIGLPAAFNRSNAAMAAVAASEAGGAERPDLDTALARTASVGEVAGRFATVTRAGARFRLLLAKNPAGWTAVFDLFDEEHRAPADLPVVLSVNARIADGLDTSWLWDVPFERLRGRTVVATGERCRDLAVRLHYAEVDHVVVADPVGALDRAAGLTGDGAGADIEFLGNYTAFADLRGRL